MKKFLKIITGCFFLILTQSATATLLNLDVTNLTNRFPGVDDIHIKLVSVSPITINQTYSVNPHNNNVIPLQPAIVTGNGTTSVSLDWTTQVISGQKLVIANGQQVHIGFSNVDTIFQNAISISESYWTDDGVRIGPVSGLVSPIFIPDIGPSPRWLVTRVSLFNEVAGPNIGTMWWQNSATSANFFNLTTLPVFASTSVAFFDSMVPLEELNGNLLGFGPESEVQFYAPISVPEPSTPLLFFAGFAGIILSRRLVLNKISVKKLDN